MAPLPWLRRRQGRPVLNTLGTAAGRGTYQGSCRRAAEFSSNIRGGDRAPSNDMSVPGPPAGQGSGSAGGLAAGERTAGATRSEPTVVFKGVDAAGRSA